MAPDGAQTRIFGSVDRYKVVKQWECVKKDQDWLKSSLCFCRPPPAENCNFSGHLKSANPVLWDFESNTLILFDFEIYFTDYLRLWFRDL